jgi:hypothetical protein
MRLGGALKLQISWMKLLHSILRTPSSKKENNGIEQEGSRVQKQAHLVVTFYTVRNHECPTTFYTTQTLLRSAAFSLARWRKCQKMQSAVHTEKKDSRGRKQAYLCVMFYTVRICEYPSPRAHEPGSCR